jgi:hypothetical protein
MCDVRVDELGFTNYSDKNILRRIPKGSFLDMGLFPNELHYFQYHMDEFRKMFRLKEVFIKEAQNRSVMEFIFSKLVMTSS